MSIKNWKEDDQPREKLVHFGRKSLSDSELIAILIGHGSGNHSAVDIAKTILESQSHSLENLNQLSIHELKKYIGIGTAKAVTIQAALELGARMKSTPPQIRTKIITSRNAFDMMHRYFSGLVHEEFYLLLLSQAMTPIHITRLSQGATTSTVVDIKLIVKWALDHLATNVIIAHNHPSGNLEPSREDVALTQRVQAALRLFDISLRDHLILYENQYYSFADNEKLEQPKV